MHTETNHHVSLDFMSRLDLVSVDRARQSFFQIKILFRMIDNNYKVRFVQLVSGWQICRLAGGNLPPRRTRSRSLEITIDYHE